MAVSASQESTTLLVREQGLTGLPGTDGTDGTGIQTIRMSKVNNPLCHLFKTNNITETLSGALTWTRSTTATYVDRYGVVQSAAIDTPREEVEGFLIEGASTNLLTYSEDFSHANWTKIATATVNSNTDTAPDGALTADTLNFPAVNDIILQNSGVSSSSKTFTGALWLKGVAGETITIEATNGVDSFTAKQITLTNSFVRVQVSNAFTATAATARLNVTRAATDTATSVVAWGAQLEELPFASSYIPTTTSAVTRTADTVSIAFDNNAEIGDQPFTYFLNFDYFGYTSNNRVFATDTDGVSERFRLSLASSSIGNFVNGSVGATNIAGLSVNTILSVAIASDGNTINAYLNGAIADSDTLITPATTAPTNIKFMSGHSSLNDGYGHIKDFRAYDFALNAAEADFLS